jgi:hypothetical protein
MQWNSIQTLKAGQLALLRFDAFHQPRWVGYVEADGVCAWPEKVAGNRPDAWRELVPVPSQ